MTIDTLSYMKRLELAGLDRKLAEAHAEAIRDDVASQLATKLDLDRMANRLEAAMWWHSLAIVLGGLTVGGFLIKLGPS